MKIVSKFKIDGKETSGLYYDKVEKINVGGEDHRFAKEVNTTKIVKEAVSEPFTRMELVGNSQQDHKTKSNIKSNGYCVKYNQLVENGDFSQGTTGWRNQGSSTQLSVTNKVVEVTVGDITSTTPYSVGLAQSFQAYNGHIYFTTFKSKSDVPTTLYEGNVLGGYRTNTTTEWTKTERIFTRTGNTGATENCYIALFNPSTSGLSIGQKFYIKDVMVVDLTDMFGAGNEPTTLEAFYLTYQGMFFKRGYVEYGYGLLGSGVYKINQLAQPTWAGEQYGVTRAYPVENFIRSVTLNGTASITMDWSMFTFDAIKDHYYLIHSYPGRANYLKIWYSGAISSGDTYDEYYIIKANSTGLASVYFSLYQNQNYNIKFTPSVVDLTDIGADNLTTVTQLRSSRPEVFATMRNYPLGTIKYGYIFNDGTIFDLEYDYIDLSKITTWQMTAPGKFMAVINDINMYECGVDDLPDIYVENGKYTPYVYNNYGDAYDKGITTYKYGESTIYLRINDSDYQTLDSFINSLPGIKMKYYTKYRRPLLGTETFTSTGKLVRKIKRIDVNTQLGYWGEWPDGTMQEGYKGYFTYGAFVNIPASRNGYCNLFERNTSAYGGYPEGFNFHGDYISFNVKTSDFPTLNDFLSYADSHGLFVLYEDEDNVMEFDDMEPEITATVIKNEIDAVNYPYTTPTPKFPESVLATDTLSIKGKNLFGGTVYINMPRVVIIKDIYLEANKTYTVSCENNINAIYVQNNKSTQTLFYRYSGKSLTFTPTKSDYYAFNFDRNNAQSTHQFKLEEGYSATLYEPHFESQTVTNLGLPAIGTAKNKILASKNVGKNLFGDMHYAKGTYAYARLPISNKYTISLKLKEGKTIPSGLYLGVNNKGDYTPGIDVTWLISNGGLQQSSATVNTSTDKYIYFSVFPKNYADTIEEYFDIQVETGLVKTDYEPYIKNKVMRYVTVKDYDLGDLSYGTDTIGRGKYFYSRVDTMIPDIKTPSSTSQAANALCDVYNVVARSQLDNGPDHLLIVAQSGQLNIFDIDKQNMTAQQFKESMAGHKLTYEIAHPYWEDITNTPEGQQILSLIPEEHYTNNVELDHDGTLNVNYWQQHDVVPSDYTRVKSLISDGNQNIVVDPGQADSMQYNSLEMSQPRTDLFKEPSKKIINVDGIGLKYNQLFNIGYSISDFSLEGNVYKRTSNNGNVYISGMNTRLNSSYLKQGHSFFVKLFNKLTGGDVVIYWDTSNYNINTAFSSTTNNERIVTPTSIGSGSTILINSYVPIGYEFILNVVDLTDMFGAGNEPTTLEQFYATRQGKLYKSYVEYGYHILGAGEYFSDQLVEFSNFRDIYYPVLLENDGSKITCERNGSIGFRDISKSTINEHYYLIYIEGNITSNGQQISNIMNNVNYGYISLNTFSIIRSNGDRNYQFWYYTSDTTVVSKMEITNVIIVDLTELGLDHLTLDQLKVQRPDLFIPQPYHETETRYGIIFSDGSVDRLDYIYVDLGDFNYWYNTNNKRFNITSTLPDIIVISNTSKVGEVAIDGYETTSLDNVVSGDMRVATFNGYVYMTNNAYTNAADFKNAMKGKFLKYRVNKPKPLYAVNDIKDVYKTNGVVNRKFGIVDLGTLGYSYQDSANRFISYSLQDTIKRIGETSTKANILCGRYENGSLSSVSSKDKGIAVYLNYLYIKDSQYTNATDLKNSLQGVYLIYELATPTTELREPISEEHMANITGVANEAYAVAYKPQEVSIAKYYKDNKPIGNYIPVVRNSDSKPGMYDPASNVFKTNTGTGEFSYDN